MEPTDKIFVAKDNTPNYVGIPDDDKGTVEVPYKASAPAPAPNFWEGYVNLKETKI